HSRAGRAGASAASIAPRRPRWPPRWPLDDATTAVVTAESKIRRSTCALHALYGHRRASYDLGRIRGTPIETPGDKMNAKRSPLASGRGGLRVESGRRTRAPRGRGRGLWRDRQPGHGEGADGGRDHLRSQRRPLYLQDGRLLTLDRKS